MTHDSGLPAMLSRRQMLRVGVMGVAAAGGAGLLAACGSSGDKASTSAPKGSAPKSSAGKGSTAGSSTSSGGGSGSYGTIKLQLSWIHNFEFDGEYVATHNGYYKDAGFDDVQLLAGGTSTTAESLLLANKVDVGLSSPPITAAAMVSSQAPLKIIGATYQKNPFAFASLENKTPIRTVKDLIGKKVGVQSGGNQILFNGLLKANGIKSSDVEVVGVEYDDSVLLEGKVDAFMTYVIDNLALSEQGYKPVILSFADNGLPFVAETYTVLQDTIDKRRDMLKALLTAEIRGWTAAIKDPTMATNLDVDDFGKSQKLDYKQEYGDEVETVYELIVDGDTKKYGLLTMTDGLIAENMKSLAAMGYDLKADQLFDLSLLAEVYKEHPELRVDLSPTHSVVPAH